MYKKNLIQCVNNNEKILYGIIEFFISEARSGYNHSSKLPRTNFKQI